MRWIDNRTEWRERWMLLVGSVLVMMFCFGMTTVKCAEDSETQKAYLANWEAAQQAYGAQDYQKAALHYGKVCELLPFEPTSRFQLACCQARLGNKEKALAALNEAIRFGWDDPKGIEQAGDLKSLRDHPQFAELVKEAAVCGAETIVVFVPQTVVAKQPTPLVVLLQGLGSGPRSELPYWKEAAERLGLIIVAPRGVTKAGSMMYGWQRAGAKDSKAMDYFDLASAGKRIDEAISLAKQRCTVDKDRVVLAGFSQGGGVALHLLGKYPEKYCGAVAVCSLYQPPGVEYWQAVAQRRAVRVSMLAGQLDRLLPRSQQAVEEVRYAKLPLKYEVMEHTGHEYPADYVGKISGALEFVLDRPKAAR